MITPERRVIVYAPNTYDAHTFLDGDKVYDDLINKVDAVGTTGNQQEIIPYHAVKRATVHHVVISRPTPIDAMCGGGDVYSIVPVAPDDPVSDDGTLIGSDFLMDVSVNGHTITGTLLCNPTGLDDYGEGNYLTFHIVPQDEYSDAQFFVDGGEATGWLTRIDEEDYTKNVYFVKLEEGMGTLTVNFGEYKDHAFTILEIQHYALNLTYESCGD